MPTDDHAGDGAAQHQRDDQEDQHQCDRCQHLHVTVDQVLQVEGGGSDAGDIHGGGGERALLRRFVHCGLDLAGSLCAVCTPFVSVAVDQQIRGAAVGRHQLVQRSPQPRICQRPLRNVETAGGAALKLRVDFLQSVGQLVHLGAQRLGETREVSGRSAGPPDRLGHRVDRCRKAGERIGCVSGTGGEFICAAGELVGTVLQVVDGLHHSGQRPSRSDCSGSPAFPK